MSWRGRAFLACFIAFGLLGWLVSQPGIPPLDTATTAFLHGLANPTLDWLMNGATFLGSTPVLAAVTALVAAILVMRGRSREAAFIVVSLAGSLVLNDALKELFHRSRPGFEWAAFWPETSFPSGHSMDSFVVYVGIALVVWHVAGRRAGSVALAVAIALVLGVGTSRIYLGAHWLSDVAGGYLAGALWLLFLLEAWARVSRLAGGRPDDTEAGEMVGRTSVGVDP